MNDNFAPTLIGGGTNTYNSGYPSLTGSFKGYSTISQPSSMTSMSYGQTQYGAVTTNPATYSSYTTGPAITGPVTTGAPVTTPITTQPVYSTYTGAAQNYTYSGAAKGYDVSPSLCHDAMPFYPRR